MVEWSEPWIYIWKVCVLNAVSIRHIGSPTLKSYSTSLLMSSISKYQIVKISKYQNLKLLKKLSFAKFFIRNYTFSCQIWIQNVLTFDLVMKNLAKLSFFSNFRFWYFVILTIWYFDIEDMSRLLIFISKYFAKKRYCEIDSGKDFASMWPGRSGSSITCQCLKWLKRC